MPGSWTLLRTIVRLLKLSHDSIRPGESFLTRPLRLQNEQLQAAAIKLAQTVVNYEMRQGKVRRFGRAESSSLHENGISRRGACYGVA